AAASRSKPMRASHAGRARWCTGLAMLVASLTLSPDRAVAASSAGCDGGAFSLLGLSGDRKTIVLAGSLDNSFLVKGKYVEFTVESATFGVRDWTLTGAPNPLDITGGTRI